MSIRNNLSGFATVLASLAAFPRVAISQDIDVSRYASRETIPDPSAGPCPQVPRSLERAKGDLYRHTSNAGPLVHSGLVLITKDGALIIDPAMTCTAAWLRDEIKVRFHVPVKYVIYTHAHFDHIGGAQLFQQEGAVVIAQRNALEPIVGERLPTAVPNRVFDKEMTIVLGGDTVILHHIAPSHSNSMTMVSFPQFRALQCTDVCENHTMPYNDFLDFYYDGWIETLEWVVKQDVDIIDIGHYTPATVADERALLAYMLDLHQQVLTLVRKGQSWDELYRNVTFSDSTKQWFGYDSMHLLNIVGMYRWVTNHRRGVW